MDIEEAMRTQRAIRRLRPDPVDDSLVLHLIELALKAPTGGNQQNWEFVVVKDREVKRRRPARHGDRVANAEPAREVTLETLQHRPEREPARAQDLDRKLLLAPPEVGPGERNPFVRAHPGPG